MTGLPPIPPPRSLPVVLLCWVAAAGFIVLAAGVNGRIIRAAGDFEALWRLSPANVEGRGACAAEARAAPPFMFDPDSYCWIALAQEHQRAGVIRLKTFPFDNAPYGREEHWSSSFAWWLWLLGGATHLVTGQPVAAAIASAALWANPLLFAGFLLTLGLIFRRAFGAWPTGILLITLASLWGVQWDFSYGRPDHHGLHLMTFLGMTLAALAARLGFAGPEQVRDARRWMIGSGLCGAAGLWIGATQQCVAIGALGAGVGLAALTLPRGERLFRPELWRLWARVGAAGSSGFYLLEYFPSHLGMRLEVNHPLYALAWLGGGEGLWILGRWKLAGQPPPGAAWRGALALAAIGALPAAMLLGPRAWCVFRDPWLKHVFALASEGRPWLAGVPAGQIANQLWQYTGALLLALPLGAAALRVGRSRAPGVVVMLPMAAMFLGWTLLQGRWIGFLEASLALLALALPRRPGAGLPLGLLALTVPGWAGNCALQIGALADDPIPHARVALTESAAQREVAWNLRLLPLAGERPARVMSPSGASPALHYFGGAQTVGSFYWDNPAGALAQIQFYMDDGDAAARRIARERGLDYVLTVARPEFVLELQAIQLGRTDLAAARRTLAFRLANPLKDEAPPWLERVPLRDAPLAVNRGYRLYRVVRARLGD